MPGEKSMENVGRHRGVNHARGSNDKSMEGVSSRLRVETLRQVQVSLSRLKGYEVCIKSWKAIRPSILIFGVVDAIAALAYVALPQHSLELAVTNSDPFGIFTHIFSHVSVLHLLSNSFALLAYTTMLALLGGLCAAMMGKEEVFLRFVKRWTVPLFFITSVASGAITYFAFSATGRTFSMSGMSDGVYGVATGLAFASFMTAFNNLSPRRDYATILKVATVAMLFYVFWMFISTSEGNLGHMLGVLSATALVTAIDAKQVVSPRIVALWQGRRLVQ
jgi:membrane associated rhomboid family serine protease